MIGEMEIKVNGKAYTIKADWRSGQLIAERVADPFTILQEFAKAQFLDTLGQSYTPSVEINMTTSVKILHAGLDDSGLSLDDVGNAFVGVELPNAINWAMEYISLFSSGAGELDEVGEADEGKAKAVDGASS